MELVSINRNSLMKILCKNAPGRGDVEVPKEWIIEQIKAAKNKVLDSLDVNEPFDDLSEIRFYDAVLNELTGENYTTIVNVYNGIILDVDESKKEISKMVNEYFKNKNLL